MSPFQALYGRLSPIVPHYWDNTYLLNDVDKELKGPRSLVAIAQNSMYAANNRMKQLADAKWRDMEFSMGDWVFLKLLPYR